MVEDDPDSWWNRKRLAVLTVAVLVVGALWVWLLWWP
jgi:hypothetical protein